MSALPKPLTAKLEKEWDADLFSLNSRNPGLAVRLGWGSYHTLYSRGAQPGYPDRTLWKNRVIFAELKRELTGAKSEDANRVAKPAQVKILDGLARGGAEVYLWRPSDLDEIARILAKPWVFGPFRLSETGSAVDFGDLFTSTIPPHLSMRCEEPWVPRSIWVPGFGRADEAGIAA